MTGEDSAEPVSKAPSSEAIVRSADENIGTNRANRQSCGGYFSRKSPGWRRVLSLGFVGILSITVACGSGSGSAAPSQAASGGTSGTNGPPVGNTVAQPANNVAELTVNLGPNFLFTTVTICAPGTTTCATIPNVLVDTGSYGLRVLASPAGASGTAVSSLGLPQIKAPNNLPLVECVTFLDQSFIWGPVQAADVNISGETASNISVQIIGEPNFLQDVPTDCGSGSSRNNNSVQTLRANGILGIGPLIQDCGTACAAPNPPVPGLYYACAAGGAGTCSPLNRTNVPVASQVSNPIAFFAQDNNGSIIELPAISSAGQTSVTGSLVFGIGTQDNNALGNATVLPQVSVEGASASNNPATFTTEFAGQSFPNSFIDSGSNGMYFLTSSGVAALVGGNPLPLCLQSGAFRNDPFISSFYCGTFNGSATNVGTDGSSTVVSFSVANAESQFLANGGANEAFNNIAGPNPSSFDWGMPFFFGHNVYTAIEHVTPPSGVPVGPFWAY